MEVVLTRLQEFTCNTTTFDDGVSVGQDTCRVPQTRHIHLGEGLMDGFEHRPDAPYNLGIEHALTWLRTELMEMRFQDQALTRQLISLHWGIQELKQELSEKEEQEEEEADSSWDSDSDEGSGSSGEKGLNLSCGQIALPPTPGPGTKKVFSRRCSVP